MGHPCRWMVSGRTADLARCGIEGALEVECLAYTLKLAQERGANMSCEVKAVEGLIAARQQNRFCLCVLLFDIPCMPTPTQVMSLSLSSNADGQYAADIA